MQSSDLPDLVPCFGSPSMESGMGFGIGVAFGLVSKMDFSRLQVLFGTRPTADKSTELPVKAATDKVPRALGQPDVSVLPGEWPQVRAHERGCHSQWESARNAQQPPAMIPQKMKPPAMIPQKMRPHLLVASCRMGQ